MPKFFVDGIWPRRRVNLIAGASGAGKTRFMAPQLFALLDGKPILGRSVEKLDRISYVACDRTSEDACDTMSDMGYDPKRLHIYSFMDNEVEWQLNKVVEAVPFHTQLIYIEAIGALVPHGKINDYHEVLRFGRSVNKVIRQTGSEVLGSTHVPKLKKDEGFKHERENIFGAASWAGIAGTIVVVEEQDDERRDIHILTRDGRKEKFTFEFNEQGHLVESSQVLGTYLLDRWLTTIPMGTDLTTAFIQEQGQKYRLGRATVTRWIAGTAENGLLLAVSRGLYTKRSVS